MADPSSSISSAILQLDSIFERPPLDPRTSSKGLKRVRREPSSISTPALMSLLPASRKRQRISSNLLRVSSGHAAESASVSSAAYEPNSRDSLLERLSTFTLSLWNDAKPDVCGAVSFAEYGWRSTGRKREEVQCGVCGVIWTIQNARDWKSGVGKMAAKDLCTKVREEHKRSCPWHARPCPRKPLCNRCNLFWLMKRVRSASLYQLPLSQPPLKLFKDLLTRALSIPQGQEYAIAYPLTSDQSERLRLLVASEQTKRLLCELGCELEHLPQENIAIALFGWRALPSTHPSSHTESRAPSDATILQCRFCSRRIVLKPRSSSASSSSSLSSVAANVELATSHRRFCAYLQAISPNDSRQGWAGLLELILTGHRNSQNPQNTRQGELDDGRLNTLNKVQVKSASAANEDLTNLHHI